MNIESIIKEQEAFLTQVELTTMFLKSFAYNTESFGFLLGEDVKEAYDYEKYKHNPEYIWETIDEITCDIVYGYRKFNVVHTGLFPVLVFAKAKKKKATITQIFAAFDVYSYKEWEI